MRRNVVIVVVIGNRRGRNRPVGRIGLRAIGRIGGWIILRLHGTGEREACCQRAEGKDRTQDHSFHSQVPAVVYAVQMGQDEGAATCGKPCKAFRHPPSQHTNLPNGW
jgi:hypothetical protein